MVDDQEQPTYIPFSLRDQKPVPRCERHAGDPYESRCYDCAALLHGEE
jgi:hypothetical protein